MGFFDGLGRMFVGQSVIWFGLYEGWFNNGLNHPLRSAVVAALLGVTCIGISVARNEP